jgi:hypothetical protein
MVLYSLGVYYIYIYYYYQVMPGTRRGGSFKKNMTIVLLVGIVGELERRELK